MKKALIIAAVALASTSAFASKARRTSLATSPHLNDIQDVMTEPDKAVAYGEWATLEFGETTLTGANNAKAEGGFVRNMGNSALGAYVGQQSTSIATYRAFSADYLGQENPIRVFYASKAGDMSWGAGLFHTSSKKKVAETTTTGESKQDGMGITAGASTDVWEAKLTLGLGNNASYKDSNDDKKLTGKTTASLGGGYKMDTLYIYGDYTMGGAKSENNSTTDMDRGDSSITVGVINTHKKDATDFFYGISYVMSTLKDDAETPTSLNATSTALTGTAGTNANKIEATSMPIIVGIESEAASWLVLRGSVTQTFGMLGLAKVKVSEKTSSNEQEYTGRNNTTVSAGAGIKWNKFTLDAVIAASNDDVGSISTDDNKFLTNASLTYMF